MVYLRQFNIEDISDPYYAVSDVDASSRLYDDASSNAEPTLTGGADWNVSNCCSTYMITFLSCAGAYLVIIAILWKTILLKPMKLIAVFVHGKLLRLRGGSLAYTSNNVFRLCIAIFLYRNGTCHRLLDDRWKSSGHRSAWR